MVLSSNRYWIMKTDRSRWTKGLNHYSCYISKSRNWKEHHTTARSCWNLSTGDKFDLGCLICQGHNYSVQQQTTFCPIKIWKNKKYGREASFIMLISNKARLCAQITQDWFWANLFWKLNFPVFDNLSWTPLKKTKNSWDTESIQKTPRALCLLIGF